jgi:hypothetical protein
MTPPPTSPLPRLLRAFLPALAFLFLLPSCSGPSFHRAWKAAAASAPADPVSGRWEGTWQSRVNGHHGRLQCVVTPPDQPGGPHLFHYRATWMRFLSGSYRAAHSLTPSGKNTWSLSGSHALPAWAGGLYQYQGSLAPDSFSASYECEIDRGTYTLKRPPAPSSVQNTLAKSSNSP